MVDRTTKKTHRVPGGNYELDVRLSRSFKYRKYHWQNKQKVPFRKRFGLTVATSMRNSGKRLYRS